MLKKLVAKINFKKVILIILVLLIAAFSITLVSKYATSPEFHKNTINELDEKKMTALGLTATITATSAAVSAIPGDAATPIAEQISNLTTPLLIIVCAIYLEKFLLTTLGYISFDILIPLSCLLICGYIIWRKNELKALAIKLTTFALAISLIIPASVKITQLMEITFKESISQTMNEVENLESSVDSNQSEESKSWWDKIVDAADELGDKVGDLLEKAKNALSVFVDAIAMLVITTCIIPIAVIFFFIWIIKLLFGLNVDISKIKTILPKKKH